jgi:dextranase
MILDLFPSRGYYRPGDLVDLLIHIQAEATNPAQLRVEIQHLADAPAIIQSTLLLAPGDQTITLSWMPPARPAGYGIRAMLFLNGNTPVAQATTAFDVLPGWQAFPRYGFLTDFSAGRSDPDSTLDELLPYHINGLQFYDWQFRHDCLMAPTADYLDPLGRSMSLGVVRSLVEAAHKRGMAALPYLAIYAASAAFWRAHIDWALYDQTGQPIPFGDDFLGLMDPSRDSPWSQHLLAEAGRALAEIPFDGLHIDQYGDPKQAWDAAGRLVDLPQAFTSFIQTAAAKFTAKTVLFNAVGNWPIEALAASPLDFLYIEVWPPVVEYRQLAQIVLDAVMLSGGKPVVIALYIPAERTANILLADAVIAACGGTRIELGEETRLLADPYFPKHQALQAELKASLRRLYDYFVRYGEWLGSYTLTDAEKIQWAAGSLDADFVTIDPSIWCVVRSRPDGMSLTLVNFSGLDIPRWDISHPAPRPRQAVPVTIAYPRQPQRISWCCPEQTCNLQTLEYIFSDGIIRFTLPQIQTMGMIIIHG